MSEMPENQAEPMPPLTDEQLNGHETIKNRSKGIPQCDIETKRISAEKKEDAQKRKVIPDNFFGSLPGGYAREVLLELSEMRSARPESSEHRRRMNVFARIDDLCKEFALDVDDIINRNARINAMAHDVNSMAISGEYGEQFYVILTQRQVEIRDLTDRTQMIFQRLIEEGISCELLGGKI